MFIHSCVFYTSDISRVKKFYTELLNLTVERENDEYISFIFSNGVRLGIKKVLKKEKWEVMARYLYKLIRLRNSIKI